MTVAPVKQRFDVTVATGSFKAQEHTENEDAALAVTLPNVYMPLQGVLIIADGVGGRAGGHDASTLAIEIIVQYLATQYSPLARSYRQAATDPEILAKALTFAHQNVVSRAKADTRKAEMRTMCAALLSLEDQVVIANVGDTRIYRLAGDQFAIVNVEQDSEAGDAGSETITEQTCLGATVLEAGQRVPADLHIRVQEYPVKTDGERWLLCSDGLYKSIAGEIIGEVLNQASTAEEAVDQLLAKARRYGAEDDTTAAVLFITPSHAVHMPEANPLAEKAVAPCQTRKPAGFRPLLWLAWAVLINFVLTAGLIGAVIYLLLRLHQSQPLPPYPWWLGGNS